MITVISYDITNISYSSSVFFRANNHLLWISNSSRPDLGGSEMDDNYYTDEHMNPETSIPSCYRSICMELNMDRLAINTIMNEHLMDEHDNTMKMMDGKKGMHFIMWVAYVLCPW